MRLEIRGDKPINEVQRDFSVAYPFLKLEFFKNGNTRKDRYPAEKLIPRYVQVKDAWFQRKQDGEIEVSDAMTVLELENVFMDRFGLAAQVFRKSGNLWLETTITDNWTLKQQNDHGREISTENRNTGRRDYDFNK